MLKKKSQIQKPYKPFTMPYNNIKGLGVAMVTPFTDTNDIDYRALEKLMNHLLNGGADFLVVMGTTAETATLSENEKNELLSFVKEINNGQLPIVLGIGGNNTAKVVETFGKLNLDGVSAILSVTPYYNKPTQKGLELHFKTLAKESPLPIILYNVPGRTGVNMAAETTIKLANEEPNIIGVKEASGNINQQSFILRDKPKDFLVLSGDDALALPQLSLGFDGVISVVGNAFPTQFSKMISLARNGKFNEAAQIHFKIIEIINNLFVDGNPGGIKAALNILGLIQNNLRLPLAPVSQKTYNTLSELIKHFN